MSWTRVWIHAVFTTKNRAKLIHQNFRQDLFDHIKMNAKENFQFKCNYLYTHSI